MGKSRTYKHQVIIKADVSSVWDALLNPDLTQHYMFGCIPISDWKIGSPLVWRGAVDGIDYVKGFVLKFEPKKILSTSVFGPNEGYNDIPENYLTSEYKLTSSNGETILDITQGDYAKVDDGEKRYAEAGDAWEVAMQGLKKLLEA